MEDKMYKPLLQAWMEAYEKAIVDRERGLGKKTIDDASCEAVESWTNKLIELGLIEPKDAIDRSISTMNESINHHIDNLIKGDMWTENDRPTIQKVKDDENLLEITVKKCAYQGGCKWALTEAEFRKNGQYRCQRLGCFVGAVKKYMTDEALPHDQRDKVEYLMTNVMEIINQDECQCQGFVFINDNFRRKELLKDNPTKLPI